MNRQSRKNAPPSQLPDGRIAVLEGYLKGWIPAPELADGVVVKSSREIAEDIEDMADVSVSDVADVMAALGFSVHYDGIGIHGWMMRRSPGAAPNFRNLSLD